MLVGAEAGGDECAGEVVDLAVVGQGWRAKRKPRRGSVMRLVQRPHQMYCRKD